jgi:8-oxo-dGTP pyrophosphatase MutT (NUDIX family)
MLHNTDLIDQLNSNELDNWVQRKLAVANYNPPNDVSPHLRQAAVLLPLHFHEKQWNLLFTRRTETVIDHKGQVSFPGGAREDFDLNAEATALRESFEEIGLQQTQVKILGMLPAFQSISSYQIVPVVARIHWPVKLTLSAAEVSRVFSIPVRWLAECDHWQERIYRQYPVIFYDQFDGEQLWGITASITQLFLRQMGWMAC